MTHTMSEWVREDERTGDNTPAREVNGILVLRHRAIPNNHLCHTVLFFVMRPGIETERETVPTNVSKSLRKY